MRPVLFTIFDFPVHSYSVFVSLAYVAGLVYGLRESRRLGEDPVNAIDLSLVLFISGFLGARLLFVVVAHEKFFKSPWDVLKIWQGGLVFYGGLILATVAAVAFIRWRRLGFGKWADICAPVAMIGLAIGRVGCLLGGCCYGKMAPHLHWAITYPVSHPSPALGLAQAPVHPTPAYSSLAAFAVFVALMLIKGRKKFDGQLFLVMVALYSAARFVLEFFRGDPRGEVPLIGLSTSQTVSVAAFLVSVAVMAWLYPRGGRSDADSDEGAVE